MIRIICTVHTMAVIVYVVKHGVLFPDWRPRMSGRLETGYLSVSALPLRTMSGIGPAEREGGRRDTDSLTKLR